MLTLQENPPNIIGDYSKIYRVFQNIIDNGIKYNQSILKKIEVNHIRRNDKIYFHVKDNGIGIESEFQERIFQPFKRLHNRNVYNGSGIGLAFCTEVMSQFGGSIYLVSEENNGSTFTLLFPEIKDSS